MKSLFQVILKEKMFVSGIDILPSRSVFIKYRISVINTADSIEELENAISLNHQSIINFKFLYVNIDKNKIEYNFWKTIVGRICIALNNDENYDHPELCLCVMHINNKWIFGIVYKK